MYLLILIEIISPQLFEVEEGGIAAIRQPVI